MNLRHKKKNVKLCHGTIEESTYLIKVIFAALRVVD